MMQDATGEKLNVRLMGCPRIAKHGVSNPSLDRLNADSDAMRLMALLMLSLLTKRTDSAPLAPGAEHDADRKWLVAHFRPDLAATDEKRARDHFSYVLKKLNGVLHVRLNARGGPSEYAVIGVTLDHLSIDVRTILRAARLPHDEKHQDVVIRLGAQRLLEGMEDLCQEQPAFQELRRFLDDRYLDALFRKTTGLRVKMESAIALSDLDQANTYRTQALPLIEQGLERLCLINEPHPCAEQFSDLQSRFAHLIRTDDARQAAHVPPTHHIPRRITSFVGREPELTRLATLLLTDRIVTITGIGGCGKTRLALQAAAAHAERLGCDVWTAELAGVTNASDVPRTVAHALGLSEPHRQTHTEALIDRLRSGRTLLLLDNCEHLKDECAHLAERLVQSCLDVTILATSRQPLNIDGEYQFRLKPLRVPPTTPTAFDTPDPVATLLEYESARLFVDRVRLHNEFPVGPEHVRSIASICTGLDGIPLALELAAARAAALSLNEINDLLSDRFQLLADGRTTALPRHKTLRAVIDWSYDLLTEREQHLLCRLAVFAGGWTLEGARRVCAFGDIPKSDVPVLLTSLVDKSLITLDLINLKTVRPAGRYRMLETVRQYARDRLRERSEWETTHLRHWKACAVLAKAAGPRLVGPDANTWLDLLDAEIENLRGALAWCLDASDPERRVAGFYRAERLVNALGWLWTIRGYLSEGRQWLDQILRLATGRPSSKERAKTLDWAGKLAWRQGDYAVAVSRLEESLALLRRFGAPCEVAVLLNNLGIVLHGKGDYADSKVLLDECLAIARPLGDWRTIANALNNLGTLAYDMCDYRESQRVLEEALSIYREIRYHEGIAHASTNLGIVADYRGCYEKGQAFLEDGLRRHREMGDLQSGAEALMCLGINAEHRSDYTAARGCLEESKAVFLQLGDRHHIAVVLNVLGFVAYEQGDSDGAEALFRESLELYRKIDVPRGTVPSLHGLGLIDHGRGDVLGALSLFREGVTLAAQIGDKLGVVNCLEGIAAVSAAAPEKTIFAARLWGASETLRERLDAPTPPSARRRQDAKMHIVRATLGDATFTDAFSSGRILSWEQAVATALEASLA